jgi:hypothetical protein
MKMMKGELRITSQEKCNSDESESEQDSRRSDRVSKERSGTTTFNIKLAN